MAKGYIVADIHVRDKEGFEKFREMVLPVVKEYGAKILVRTPNAEAREGKKPGVVVVFEFERAWTKLVNFMNQKDIQLQKQ